MALVWAVNGSKFTADAARAETFKNTSGGRGVTLPGDLKVTALPTPGAFVRVASGSGTMPAGYVGAPGQSYGVLEMTSNDVPVPATGSGSAVTRYLIMRVVDPQFEGQPPADPVNAEYRIFEWVSSIAPGAIAKPYLPLVKLVQPASTATITNAMLTDIRKLTRPRFEHHTLMSGPTVEQSPTTSGGIWPNYRPTVEVPEWANWLTLKADLYSVGHRNGTVNGQLTATLGAIGDANQLRAANAGFDLDLPPGAGVRISLGVGGAGLIPAALRGTTQPLGTEAIKQSGTGNIFTVTGTQVIYTVTFTEKLV